MAYFDVDDPIRKQLAEKYESSGKGPTITVDAVTGETSLGAKKNPTAKDWRDSYENYMKQGGSPLTAPAGTSATRMYQHAIFKGRGMSYYSSEPFESTGFLGEIQQDITPEDEVVTSIAPNTQNVTRQVQDGGGSDTDDDFYDPFAEHAEQTRIQASLELGLDPHAIGAERVKNDWTLAWNKLSAPETILGLMFPAKVNMPLTILGAMFSEGHGQIGRSGLVGEDYWGEDMSTVETPTQVVGFANTGYGLTEAVDKWGNTVVEGGPNKGSGIFGFQTNSYAQAAYDAKQKGLTAPYSIELDPIEGLPPPSYFNVDNYNDITFTPGWGARESALKSEPSRYTEHNTGLWDGPETRRDGDAPTSAPSSGYSGGSTTGWDAETNLSAEDWAKGMQTDVTSGWGVGDNGEDTPGDDGGVDATGTSDDGSDDTGPA